mmetsp:Transcript_100/g.258  ORF Transcript_100/g.258 Transcript_100/m.258 type:complete len:599 (+) Transcript_100:96-1892(+)
MFANIRNVFHDAAEDFSQRFERNRRGRRENHGFSQSRQTREDHPQDQPQQDQPPTTQRAPPASIKAIKQLPTIRVEPEDLVDPNNRVCCICLDDNNLDDRVTRLPCAHIFHTRCIVDWLANHSCTCPVCRYELPTDDPQFEAGRIKRMLSRKPRYAMHELKRMPISKLLELNREPASGVLEKKDLIKNLIEKNRIDLIPSPEPVEYDLEVLMNMKISELKKTMAEAGVFFRREDVLMKSDMISLFENSGRLTLIKTQSDESMAPSDYEWTNVKATIDNSRTSSSTSSFNEGDEILVETVQDDSMSLQEDSMNEKHVEPTIEMFPNQFIENTGNEIRSSEGVTTNDSMSVSPALSNTENQWPLYNDTENSLHEIPSETSDIQIPIHMENTPQDHPMTENITLSDSVESTSSDGNFNVIRPDQSIEAETQVREEMPIDFENLPTDNDSMTNLTDLRSTFQHYTINNLQTLGRDLQIDLSKCLERDEMIEIFVDADITGNSDPSALSELMFSSWSVSQLRVIATKININISECTTKDEMVEMILYAGNVERPYLRDYLRSLSPLTTKSLTDLRAIAREFRINISDCLEKDEIINRLMSRSH